jgi:integrase
MPNIRFHLNLDKKDKDGFVPIRAKICAESKARYKTIGKIKENDWGKKQTVLSGLEKQKEHNIRINKTITDLKKNAEEFFSYCTANNIQLTIEMVEDFFAGKTLNKKITKTTFKKAFEEYIETGRSTKGENTTRNYNTAKNFYFEFQENTGIKVTFENIDLQLWDEIVKYAYESRNNFLEPGSENKYRILLQPNTLAKYRNVLVSFLNWAIEREYYTGSKHLKFKAPEQNIDIIYLTEEELDKLYLHKFKNGRLDKVRDIFCLGCYTGFRYSDLNTLNGDHIQNGFIRKKLIKTSKVVEIPILPMTQDILDKYNYSFKSLPTYSDVKLNKYIKDCCEEAKINQPYTVSKYPGNKRIDITNPKYQFVVVHTARKTFINLAHKYDMPQSLIMDIVGHSEYETFLKYRKYEPEKKKKDMENAFKDYTKRIQTEKNNQN